MRIEETFIQLKRADDYNKNLLDYQKKGYNMVFLDFSSLNTEQDIFESFSLQLNFPGYFGKNWNALWDCITDLMWLNNKNTLIVINNLHLFKNEELRKRLMNQLRDAKDFWAKYGVTFDIVTFEG